MEFKNRMCSGITSFVKKICFIQAYRGRVTTVAIEEKCEGLRVFHFTSVDTEKK